MSKALIPTLAVGAALTAAAHSALVVNGDFANTEINGAGGGPNHLQWDARDLGWTVKNSNAGGGWSAAANNGTKTGDNQFGIAQSNQITSETGSAYTVSFDWTAPASATTVDNLTLDIHVVAHLIGTTPGDTDRFFTGLNFQSSQSRAIGTGGTWIDLNDASEHSGNAVANPFTALGTADVTTPHTLVLDFGDGAIEDWDYFGIKFSYGGPNAEDAISGGIIDNVVVTAIPEPSIVGLAGFGVFGFLIRRRR